MGPLRGPFVLEDVSLDHARRLDMLGELIEAKLTEALGDLDEGLELRETLCERLEAQQSAVASGERGESFDDVARRLGLA